MIPTATQTSAPAVPARAMPAEEGKRSNAFLLLRFTLLIATSPIW